MNLSRLLLWLLRFVEPVLGWRVPVELWKSTDGHGESATLLLAGPCRRTNYFKESFFSGSAVLEKSKHVPIWALQRLVDEWKEEADMVVLEIDRISARCFLKNGWLKGPPLVSSVMRVPDDLQAFARHHGHAGTDMRKVRNRPFEAVLSHEEQDFEIFFDRFHVPYVSKRHGHAASLAPRWYWHRLFKQGGIHWISYDGQRVAADLVVIKNGTMYKLINGVLDGDVEWMKAGALAALYVHAIHLAKRNGCSRIHLGGSRATLHDGVLRYKNKWGGVICPYKEGFSKHFVTLFQWQRIAEGTARFLCRRSLVYHDGTALSALWVAPRDDSRTAESLRRECEALHASGLKWFHVVVQGAVPVGFECPPGVRLVEWQQACARPSCEWGGIADDAGPGSPA